MEMEEPEKKKRKRQKKLCTEIKRQMEFYFSDANLLKDRFLKKLMESSPDKWIDIEVFQNFNKLRNLTTDMALVAKSLKSSEDLEVDESQSKVRRTKPIRDPGDVDKRTVYVECLPPTADHDWVRKVFESYGKVAYVSLPRYKSTRDIKGFAFVEFDQEEYAIKAVEAMSDTVSDDHLGKFPVGSKLQKHLQRQAIAHNIELPNLPSGCGVGRDDSSAPSDSRKRRRVSISTDDGRDVSASKKVHRDDTKALSDSENPTEPQIPIQRQKRKQDDSEAQETSTRPEDVCSANKKAKIDSAKESESTSKDAKKNRKKKKKKAVEDHSTQLKVISKEAWLALKKEYLHIQKTNVRKLKESLKDVAKKENERSTNQKNGDTENTDTGPKVEEKSKILAFTPDVIVNVTSSDNLKRSVLKEVLCKYGEIAYVDLIDGDTYAKVRCANAEHAKNIAQASVAEYTLSLLQGSEEKEYWEKIISDRQKKLESKGRSKKRGRDKVFQQVEQVLPEAGKKKHIVFD